MASLPRFDDVSRCEKCGQSQTPNYRFGVKHTYSITTGVSVMIRTCFSCRYEWGEQALDSKEKA